MQGEAVRLDALALEEGYFTGAQLAALGVGPGEVLGHFTGTAQPVAAVGVHS